MTFRILILLVVPLVYTADPEGGRVVTSSRSRDQLSSIPGIRQGFATETERDGVSVNVCTRCEHLGVTYEGNSPFTFERGCWLYDCFCYCGAGFICPSDKSKYLCGGSKQCVRCDVTAFNGSYQEPNTNFEIRRGCEFYKNCRCNCDGGWSCDEGVYTCSLETGCIVDGTRYIAGQTFDLIRGCDKHTNCVCNKGGEWNCNQVTDICGKCRKCKIGDEYFDGGKQAFPVTTNCTSYRSCDCDCDGTYTCRGGINTCNGEDNMLIDGRCPDCIIDGVIYRNGERFDYQTQCSQRSNCQCRCGTVACRDVTELCGDCRSCNVDGKTYAGGSNFSHTRDCYEYKQCECNCDGRWECFGDSAVDTCNSCKKCSVGDSTYAAYSRFKVDRKCWNYQCFCLCNGTTWCPSATVVNTCTQPDRCLICDINGRDIKGNTHFKYELNGMDMHCRCNCDGSYACIAEWLYINTNVSISGSGIGIGGSGCISCRMDGTTYRGDTKYRILRSGISLDCECNCDGSYVCYGEKRYEFQGCLGCTVGGVSYDGNNNFSTVYKGMKLECQCSCNGSYICTGSTQESMEWITIQCLSFGVFGCLPVTGAQCRSGSMVYNSGVSFLFLYKQFKVNCVCGIDGSYFCQGSSGLMLSCVGGTCVEIGCQTCTVNGQTYRHNTQFPYKYKHIDMLCTCNCDGSSYCTGVETFINVTCINGACSQIGCANCKYCGMNYQGGSDFNLVYRGLSMDCSCHCDSSYRCIDTRQDTIFECRLGKTCGPKRCKRCQVNGKRYKGRSSFTMVYQRTHVSCTCGCDGSYFCHDISTDIEFSCPRRRPCQKIGGCRTCQVNDEQYQHGEEYEIISGRERKRCQCKCDGTSHCRTIEHNICMSCTIDGVTYTGHTKNRITRDTVSYICTCNCDGSHTCEAEYKPRCKQCEIGGTLFTGDTSFQATLENIMMQCSCDCDGQYECVSEYKTCKNSGCWNTCQYCDIDGNRYTGYPGNRFEAFVFGLEMICLCDCDGSYHCSCPTLTCSSTSGCVDNCQQCIIDNRQFDENADFQTEVFGYRMRCSCECNGSYRCQNELRTCTSTSGCVDNCVSCNIDSKRFKKNPNFEAEVFGNRMRCSCECDGSYRCSSETQVCTSSGCVENCRQCYIDGQPYSRSSNFQADVYGYRMQCNCGCDGSFRCTCEEVTCSSTHGCVDNCRQCVIDNQRFDRNPNFQATVFSHRMQCSCDCTGSYRCTSETQICTTSGCVDNCRGCLIDNQRFDRNPNFQATVFSHRMQCSCDCSGSYRCTSETQICTTSGCVDNCRGCVIDNQRFDRNPNFQATVFSHRMQCSCDCTGSYRCTSETQICTTSGCVDNCRGCLIDNQRFDRNPNFQATVFSHRMQCSCDCSGSYRCTSETQICTSSGCVDNCKQCLIDGRRYTRKSNFQADVYGYRMQCNCECDGSYRCESDTRICSSSRGCVNRCQSCVINDRNYDGNTNFNAILEGISMQCKCDCNGNYECVGGSNTCTQTGCVRSCDGCLIEGKTYKGDSRFHYFSNVYGIDMRCTCKCGGSYTCRGTKEVTPCGGTGCSVAGCQSCSVSGVVYRGGTSFQTRLDDKRMKCKCSCNGGYRCVGYREQIDRQESEMRRTVVAIRPSGYGNVRTSTESRTFGSPYTSKTYKSTSGSSSRGSVSRVSDISRMMADANPTLGRKECTSTKVARKRKFSYEENCRRYFCRCFRNRKYKCDPEKTQIIC